MRTGELCRQHRTQSKALSAEGFVREDDAVYLRGIGHGVDPWHLALSVGGDGQESRVRLFGELPALELRALAEDRLS